MSGSSTIVDKTPRKSTQKRVRSTLDDGLNNAEVDSANFSSRPFDAESRHALISAAAYQRAAQRGFACGNELDDWLAAEAEVDARLQGEGRVF